MKDFHGIIFAYSTAPELRELVSVRTSASLPFCGRYRLIDFSLSSLRNAGILDVGVIMQRDYQSLLNHLAGGKPWDMSRRSGGMQILPPFGLPEYHRGNYAGTMEALNAVSSYIKDINAKYVVLMLGNMCANLDLTAPMKQHVASGAEITAICAKGNPDGSRIAYAVDAEGYVTEMLMDTEAEEGELASLEAYIINKETLLKMMNFALKRNLYRFHNDSMRIWLNNGGKMATYVHEGYTSIIRTVEAYNKASMDMLDKEKRHQLFNKELPVFTKTKEEVSTYYSEEAVSRNSLVADNCIVEGELENSIVFSGCRIGKGAVLKNCVVMRNCIIGEGCELEHVIVDKDCVFSEDCKLTGNAKLPVVVPKASKL